MNILVTGSEGLLGSNLVKHLTLLEHNVEGRDKGSLNIENYHEVGYFFRNHLIDLVIHCAAYTNVDGAESNETEAFMVNGYGTENIAVTCARWNIPMVYISTEAVFDGEKETPYTVWDTPSPISVYARSKYAGELAVQRHLNNFYIVRTNLIYGAGRTNFITFSIDTCRNARNNEILVFPVIDQRCTPTNVKTLVRSISELIQTNRWGIYHCTDSGETSRAEIVKFIAKQFGLSAETTPWLGAKAQRNVSSLLDCTTLDYVLRERSFSNRPHWTAALMEFINE